MKITYIAATQMHSKGLEFIKGSYEVDEEIAQYLLKTFQGKFKAEPEVKAEPKAKVTRKPRAKKIED